MYLKLTRGQLVGNVFRDKGDVIQADGKYAEAFVRAGAAVPVAGPAIEAATAPAPPERATAGRQGAR